MFTRRTLLFPTVGALFGLLIGGLFAYQAYFSGFHSYSDAAGTGDGILATIAKREWDTSQHELALNTLKGIDEPYELFRTLDSFLFVLGPPRNHVARNSYGQEVMFMKQDKVPNVDLPENIRKAVVDFLVEQIEYCSVESLVDEPASWDYRSRAEAYLQLEELFRVVQDEKQAQEVLALAKKYATKATELGYLEEESIAAEQEAEWPPWVLKLVFTLLSAAICGFLGCLVVPTLNEIGNSIRDGIISRPTGEDVVEEADAAVDKTVESVGNNEPLALETTKPR